MRWIDIDKIKRNTEKWAITRRGRRLGVPFNWCGKTIFNADKQTIICRGGNLPPEKQTVRIDETGGYYPPLQEPSPIPRAVHQKPPKATFKYMRIRAHVVENSILLHRFSGKLTLQFVYMLIFPHKSRGKCEKMPKCTYAYAGARIDNEEFGKMHKKIEQKW